MNPQQAQQSNPQAQNMAQPGANSANDLGDSKAALAFSNMLREGIFNIQNPPMVGGTEQGGGAPQQPPKDSSKNPPKDASLRDQYPNQKPGAVPDNQKLDQVLQEISSIKDEIKMMMEEDKNNDNGKQE